VAGGAAIARLLREFQVELLDTAPMHLRAVVEARLGRIGSLFNAVRLTLWRVEADGDAVAAEFEWCRPAYEPLRNTRVELSQFPLGRDVLLGDGPAVVLDEHTGPLFGGAEVLVVPLTIRGRLQRFLTVAWAGGQPDTEALAIDQAVLDGLFSVTAVIHGAADTSRLAELASYDERSGLANRRLLLFMLNHLLSRLGRRGGGGVGVIFCEVADRRAGVAARPVPDELMARVAKAFQLQTRATDVVGQFDEGVLAVLCDDLRDPAEAIEVARRLSQVCRHYGGDDVAPCLGVGFSDESVAPGVLLRRADLATYQARTDGTGAIRVVSA
jgi:GGDEF domain-containing protein